MQETQLQYTSEFIRLHPEAAADILELLPSSSVADLLSRLPQPQAGTLLANMLPLHAARALLQMESKPVIRMIAGLQSSQIAGILRYVDTQTAHVWLKEMPLDVSTACRLLLNYSATTVGAWMIPRVMMLSTGCTAGEALTRISQEDTKVDTDAIYVIDREKVPKGVVSVFNLLKAKKDLPLHSLMDRQTYAISGRASLASVRRHDGWNYFDTLPVLNRHRQLIGMLRHTDLRKGLEKDISSSNKIKGQLPIADLYNTYRRVLVALFDVINDVTGKNNG